MTGDLIIASAEARAIDMISRSGAAPARFALKRWKRRSPSCSGAGITSWRGRAAARGAMLRSEEELPPHKAFPTGVDPGAPSGKFCRAEKLDEAPGLLSAGALACTAKRILRSTAMPTT